MSVPHGALICDNINCVLDTVLITKYALNLLNFCYSAAEHCIPVTCNLKHFGRIPAGWNDLVQAERDKQLFSGTICGYQLNVLLTDGLHVGLLEELLVQSRDCWIQFLKMRHFKYNALFVIDGCNQDIEIANSFASFSENLLFSVPSMNSDLNVWMPTHITYCKTKATLISLL